MRYTFACIPLEPQKLSRVESIKGRVVGGASGLLARLPDITPHPAMISISYACTGNIMQ